MASNHNIRRPSPTTPHRTAPNFRNEDNSPGHAMMMLTREQSNRANANKENAPKNEDPPRLEIHEDAKEESSPRRENP